MVLNLYQRNLSLQERPLQKTATKRSGAVWRPVPAGTRTMDSHTAGSGVTVEDWVKRRQKKDKKVAMRLWLLRMLLERQHPWNVMAS